MQWNPPNQGIHQTRKTVLISGVTMYPNIVFGDSNIVPSIEVSLLQGILKRGSSVHVGVILYYWFGNCLTIYKYGCK